MTKQVPINLAVGTATTCSDAFVGDFRQMMIGMRTQFQIEVSRNASDGTYDFRSGVVFVRAYLRGDVQLAHPAHFAVIEGIL